MQAMQRYTRRLELDMASVALNKTAVGFSHGSDTFGWRFYPRVQSPPTRGTLATLGETVRGGPTTDGDLMQRQLEPGQRECTAIIVMPSFVPWVTLDVRTNWFSLAHPKATDPGMQQTLAQPTQAATPAWSVEPTPLPMPVMARRFLQAGKAWLVTSDEQGLVVVDQHALHERVMFERLKASVLSGPLESQALLVPRIEAATALEVERLDEAQPLLERLGFDVRAGGPRSIALHAEPVFLIERGVDALDVLRAWLGRDEFDASGDGEAVLSEALDMMACKAAVKAGDALSDREVSELLQQLDALAAGRLQPWPAPAGQEESDGSGNHRAPSSAGTGGATARGIRRAGDRRRSRSTSRPGLRVADGARLRRMPRGH
jgi:hypothetical protein